MSDWTVRPLIAVLRLLSYNDRFFHFTSFEDMWDNSQIPCHNPTWPDPTSPDPTRPDVTWPDLTWHLTSLTWPQSLITRNCPLQPHSKVHVDPAHLPSSPNRHVSPNICSVRLISLLSCDQRKVTNCCIRWKWFGIFGLNFNRKLLHAWLCRQVSSAKAWQSIVTWKSRRPSHAPISRNNGTLILCKWCTSQTH